MPETFHPFCREDALGEDMALGAMINGWPICVARSQEQLFAFVDKCTHYSSTLHDGRVSKCRIQCPLHGARFSLTTGASIGGLYRPLKLFSLRCVDGLVEVAVPDTKPGPEHEPARG